MADKLTVLLVDDHALVRKGFRRMLEGDAAISVVGEASEGEEAVRLTLELKPRVVVMDCALPGINGIDDPQSYQLAYQGRYTRFANLAQAPA